MSILSTLLSCLRSIIHSDDFFRRSRASDTAFTRKRILGFVDTLVYILWCTKTSLPSTLAGFLQGKLGHKQTCTKQAFSKSRRNIKPEALEELFRASVEHLVKATKPCKGYMRIFAIDGSRINLPTHPELKEAYGIQKGTGGLIQALISVMYDVEHKFILDVQVGRHDGNEREMAEEHIKCAKRLLGNAPYLILFDRGYPSAKLLEQWLGEHITFLMRCPSEFVKALPKGKPDTWVTHRFHSCPKPLTFRLIRVALPDGTEEILCTNLGDAYSTEEIVDLYTNRWKIETNYDFIKNRVQLENLSGITLCAFLQQLYACMLMDNICAAYYCDNSAYEADAGTMPGIRLRLRSHDNGEQGGKCDRRINMVTVLAAIRSILPRVLAFPHSRLKRYVETIAVPRLKNVLRYDKKGRGKPRKRRHPSLKFTQSQRTGL